MGLLDLARNRVMARIAARFQERMEGGFSPPRFRGRQWPAGSDVIRGAACATLIGVQRLIGSPILMALFDLPLAPFFLAAVYIPPGSGLVATGGWR